MAANSAATEEVLRILRQLQADTSLCDRPLNVGGAPKIRRIGNAGDVSGNTSAEDVSEAPVVAAEGCGPPRITDVPAPIILGHFANLKDVQVTVLLMQWVTHRFDLNRFTSETPMTVRTKIKSVCTFALECVATHKQREDVYIFREQCRSTDSTILTAWTAVLTKRCQDITNAMMQKLLKLELQLPGGARSRQKGDWPTLVNAVAKRLGHIKSQKVNIYQHITLHKCTPDGERLKDWQYSKEGREVIAYKKQESVFHTWLKTNSTKN